MKQKNILILFAFLFCSLVLSNCSLSLQTKETQTGIATIVASAFRTATPTDPMLLRLRPSFLAPQEFAGYFTSSFEVSSFVPCSESDLPGYGKGYWLEAGPSSGFYQLYNQVIVIINPKDNATQNSEVIMFVRFLGQLSNPGAAIQDGSSGGYGHMGLYKQEVVVIKTFDIKPFTQNQCEAK